MAIRPEALPTDTAALTEMVLALDAENEKLRVAMQTLKDMIFGKRSERLAALVAEQLALELGDLETSATPPGRGRTRTCQFWAHAMDDRPWSGPSPPAVAYVFAASRGTDEIAGQLTGFCGILQVDGYAAYKALARGHGGAIQLAFCLAHARRRFVDVYKTTRSPFAQEVIERLQAVYAIEAEIRGSSAEQRLAARCSRTAPLMEALKTRLTAMVGQLFSQSPLAEAINYTLNHWDGLTLFLRDGRVEVDSNTVERSMRPIAMGRRNSLFSGSEGGAESWAILASLVNTAKLHDLDPQAYLSDVLERIVSRRTKSHQLHELLAWNWKAARERTAQAAA